MITVTGQQGPFDWLLLTPLTWIVLAILLVAGLAGFRNARLVDDAMLTTEGVLRRGQWWRLATSGFVHADPIHLFMNLLTLFFFGPGVERIYGTTGLAFVLVVSLLAGSGWALLENARNRSYAALGASGALSGVLVVYCLAAPFAEIFVFVARVPAILFVAGYIAWSFIAGRDKTGRIGHDAHLGGAMGALVLVALLWPQVLHALVEQLKGLPLL